MKDFTVSSIEVYGNGLRHVYGGLAYVPEPVLFKLQNDLIQELAERTKVRSEWSDRLEEVKSLGKSAAWNVKFHANELRRLQRIVFVCTNKWDADLSPSTHADPVGP